jgi:tetratricopeptide (TPR) repeat protein
MISPLIFVAALVVSSGQSGSPPPSAEAAAAELEAGKYAEAEQDYRRIVATYPRMAEAYTNLGLSYFLQKKYQEAASTFQYGLKLQPAMANAWLFLGIALFELNEPARAVTPLRHYTSLKRDDAQGHYYLGISLMSLATDQEPAEELRAIGAHGHAPLPASVERFREAAQELLEAKRIDPKNTDVLYHLAQCYLHLARAKASGSVGPALGPAKAGASPGPTASRAGVADLKNFQTDFERTLGEIASIDPQSVRLHQLRAGSYEAAGDSDKAIRELEEAVKGRPRVQGLYYTLGCLYLKEYRYGEALAQFNSELALDSPYPRTYLQIGHIYTDQHRPEKALPSLQRATQAEPDSGKPWVEMGRAYVMMDQFEKAAAALEKAIKLGDNTASTYFVLSTAYRKMGRLDLAQQAVKKSEEASREQSNKAIEHVREVVAKQGSK